MIAGFHLEALLTTGYALFLVAVALGLELAARQSHERSEGFQLAGFQYHRDSDAWECPTGERLARSETDYERRLVRYRAPSHTCNACVIKKNCTDSRDGRLVERPLESWLRSEIRRFHRGLSLTLLLLAALILVAEIIHFDRPRDLLLLGGFLTPIGILGVRRVSEFWGE